MPNESTAATSAPITPAPTPNTAPIEAQDGSEGTSEESSAQQAPQTPAVIEKQLKKLKLKFNGKEEQVEFDPNDDEYLQKQFQLARLGQSKAQEFSNLQKEVNTFIEALRKNPSKVLADPNIGVDVKKLAAEIVQQEIENARKSPEQLEKERLQNELKELKDQREKEKQEFQQKELQRQTEQAVQTYDQQISDVIQNSDLPKSPYVVKKMAEYLYLSLQNDVGLEAKDIFPIVREEIMNDIKEMFQVMPEEVIEKIVGKDVFTKIRKKNVAKAKANPTLSSVQDTGIRSKQEAKTPVKKMTFKEFLGT